MIETEFTRRTGVQYPLMQGGMQWVGTAELVSAVSNAGALGVLTALTQPTPEALALEIERTRRMTTRPFAVNLTILPAINPPPYEKYVDVIINAGIKIVETAGNNPGEHVKRFKKAGILVVSIDGFECAGHPGEDDIGGLVLLARAATVLKIPYLASGGMANGRGLAAALALGAAGANMGTRFLCTQESPIHNNIKEAIVKASERDTALMFRTLHNTARVFKNKVSLEVVSIEKKGNAKFEDIRHLVAGESVGLINDIPTCAVLVPRIANEAEAILTKLSASIKAKL
ncbi:hypothetical protein HDU91_004315 [Kappamyces sp. JEL0680]|nr:hypothetical protein HDU91_004315 [Kappamyces sp. JEL0680]